jgi:hypothetical protein
MHEKKDGFKGLDLNFYKVSTATLTNDKHQKVNVRGFVIF